jgi:hypothetical protein
MPQNDQALLTRLKSSGLEFVVIDGVSVVYHGAPVATFDPGEKDLEAVKLLRAIKEKNQQPKS